MKKTHYFDYAATTPLHESVLEAMLPYMTEFYGNPGSVHAAGRKAYGAVEGARLEISRVLGCKAEQLIFTSGATESNNLVLNFTRASKGHIISSVAEHPAVLQPLKEKERVGHAVTLLPVDGHGCVNISDVEQAITAETRLVSLMYVNNELGTLNPIKAIAALLKGVNREREPNDRIQLHVDASQGLLFNDIQNILEVADYVSLSGHKIYGPKGIGLLYSRTDINIKPMFYGGGQEFGKRSGTHNVPAIVGLAQAVKNLAEYKKSEGEIRSIRDYIADELGKINGFVINTPYADKSKATSYHLNLALPGKSAEDSVLLLDMQGFAISAGSACSSKSIKSSHVMRAITDDVEVQNNSIRISCGLYSTMEAAEELVNTIKAWY